MNKLSNLKDLSSDKNDNISEDNNLEKVLCDHCGRTMNNGIRCLGICVADNEY